MTEIQSVLLKILKWFHDFCNENNLNYYAIGGTALGAERHKGFIPWDDDIDVGMPRKDYERFKELALSKINGKTAYFVEWPNSQLDSTINFCKVYETETTSVIDNKIIQKRGMFIDVFPLDGLGNSKIGAFNVFLPIDFLNNYYYLNVCSIDKHRKWYKNILLFVSRAFPMSYEHRRKLLVYIDNKCKSRDFYSKKYVANVYGGGHFREILPRDVFGTPTLREFEDTLIFIPEKIDEFLTEIYGDWRKLPPEKDRISKHADLY